MSTDVSSATPAPAATVPGAPAAKVINSGDSPISFDELDSITNEHKLAKKQAKSEAKEVAKEAAKEVTKNLDLPDKKGEAKKDEKKAKDTPDEESETKEPGEKEDKKALDAKAKETAKLEAAKKLIKGKLGEKELDLDPDTVIPYKADGVEATTTLRELLNNHSGKVSYDKKFSELALEKQKFFEKHDAINSKIRRVIEEKDPEMRLFHMAEMSGQDPVTFRAKYLDENIKLLEQWYGMSDDERKLSEKDFENKILKQERESRIKEDARRQTQSALQAKIQELGKTHQIPDQEFWGTFDKIKAAKERGNFKEKITPEIVAETIIKERLWESAASVLDAVKDFPHQKRAAALTDLVEDGFKLGLSPAEIKDAADQLWGSKAKSSVIAEKVSEQEELRTGKRSQSKPEYKGGNEALLFDDIL